MAIPSAPPEELVDQFFLGDEEFVWGLEKMMDWRVSWNRAVARAWADPDFKLRLLDPRGANSALAEIGWPPPQGLTIYVKEPIAYEQPAEEGAEPVAVHMLEWEEDLHKRTWVKSVATNEVDGSTKRDSGGKPVLEPAKKHVALNGWSYKLDPAAAVVQGGGVKVAVPRKAEMLAAFATEVILKLPPVPKTPELRALALADYDGLSRAYPFTCCCCC